MTAHELLKEVLEGVLLIVGEYRGSHAEEAGLRRDRLYATFGGKVNPQLGRVMALFAGLNVQLVVKPLQPKKKAPRPKLGRPPKDAEK